MVAVSRSMNSRGSDLSSAVARLQQQQLLGPNIASLLADQEIRGWTAWGLGASCMPSSSAFDAKEEKAKKAMKKNILYHRIKCNVSYVAGGKQADLSGVSPNMVSGGGPKLAPGFLQRGWAKSFKEKCWVEILKSKYFACEQGGASILKNQMTPCQIMECVVTVDQRCRAEVCPTASSQERTHAFRSQI